RREPTSNIHSRPNGRTGRNYMFFPIEDFLELHSGATLLPLIAQPSFHRFYNMVGGRAYRYIFKGKIADLMKFFSIGMGKFPTGLWSNIIYGTIIIGP